jgi:hypothetical protein
MADNQTLSQLAKLASVALDNIRANSYLISEILNPQCLTVRNALELIELRCLELESDIHLAAEATTFAPKSRIKQRATTSTY